MIEQKIKEFFETHQMAGTVHVALGQIFIDIEKANQFVAGTGQSVEIFLRDDNALVEEKMKSALEDKNGMDYEKENPSMSFDEKKAGDIIALIGTEENTEVAPGEAIQMPAVNGTEQLPPVIEKPKEQKTK